MGKGDLVLCPPRENQTIGFVGYRRSAFISPTKTRPAGQVQTRAGRASPLGIPTGLQFGLG